MGFLIDALVLIFLFIALRAGYKKGFAVTIISSFSYIISVILTACFYKSAAVYIASSKAGLAVSKKVGIILSKTFAQKTDALISDIPLPRVLKTGIADGEFFQNAINTLSLNITNAIITLITVILLFILIRFILKIIKGPVKAIASLPIIKHIDRFAGAAAGIIAGLFWIYTAMALIGMLSFIPFVDTIAKFIMDSDFAKAFYDNNILLYMIM